MHQELHHGVLTWDAVHPCAEWHCEGKHMGKHHRWTTEHIVFKGHSFIYGDLFLDLYPVLAPIAGTNTGNFVSDHKRSYAAIGFSWRSSRISSVSQRGR